MALDAKMVIPCTIYKQVPDEYGDLRAINPVNTTCWLRELDTLEHQPYKETEISGSMAWFRAGTDITDGDLLTAVGKTFKVQTAIVARRLGHSDPLFVKCHLLRQEATVS